MSLDALAERMGTDKSWLAKRERGEIRWTADDLARAARGLGVSPGELLG
jgi:transcriptional regulator with XRE-family HTH domain